MIEEIYQKIVLLDEDYCVDGMKYLNSTCNRVGRISNSQGNGSIIWKINTQLHITKGIV